MSYSPHLMPKVRSKLIRASAAGEPCRLRIASFVPGLQCAGQDTTVVAHLDFVGGKGMSTKVTDMAGVFSCSTCHDILAGVHREAHMYVMQKYPAGIIDRCLKGLVETHAALIENKVIVIPDAIMI